MITLSKNPIGYRRRGSRSYTRVLVAPLEIGRSVAHLGSLRVRMPNVGRLGRPTGQKAKRTGQVGKGGGKRGNGVHNGRKGVGTQG